MNVDPTGEYGIPKTFPITLMIALVKHHKTKERFIATRLRHALIDEMIDDMCFKQYLEDCGLYSKMPKMFYLYRPSWWHTDENYYLTLYWLEGGFYGAPMDVVEPFVQAFYRDDPISECLKHGVSNDAYDIFLTTLRIDIMNFYLRLISAPARRMWE